MTVIVDEGLAAHIAANSGAAHIALVGCPDPDLARRAMVAAAKAVFTVPHPEEPDEPLPSFASGVEVDDEGTATFWFDAADAEAYEGLCEAVVAAMRAAVDATGATGRLVPGGS